MDKNEAFLMMMEHPERYTDEQVQEMLADDECRELYETMRLTESAFQMEDAKRLTSHGIREEEWTKFEQRHFSPSIQRWRKMAAAAAVVVMLSGITYAAIGISRHIHSLYSPTSGASTANEVKTTNLEEVSAADSTAVVAEVITFENVPLDEMLHGVAEHYGKTLDIRGKQTHELRLFYKWNKQATLESIIADLNNFEQVHLTQHDDTLIVEP
ncbi:MAG: DUF4974 domain-containing protein [Bacteroidaceae bacterium]|nr:DUF4974 domain-containing protein [Bacteroidaceae bacterium]